MTFDDVESFPPTQVLSLCAKDVKDGVATIPLQFVKVRGDSAARAPTRPEATVESPTVPPPSAAPLRAVPVRAVARYLRLGQPRRLGRDAALARALLRHADRAHKRKRPQEAGLMPVGRLPYWEPPCRAETRARARAAPMRAGDAAVTMASQIRTTASHTARRGAA